MNNGVKKTDRLETAIAIIIFAFSFTSYYLGLFEGLESRLIDYKFSKKPFANDIDSIAVVEITETCITKISNWPVRRSLVAGVIERVIGAGAKTVALDIAFEGKTATAEDQKLFEVIKSHSKKIILGSRAELVTSDDGRSKKMMNGTKIVQSYIYSLFGRDTVEIETGCMNLNPEGMKAYGVLHDADISGPAPPLSLKAAANYIGDPVVTRFIPSDHTEKSFFINYYNGIGDRPFTKIPFSSVLAMDTDEVADLLANRLVFIGVTAKAAGAYYQTPYGDMSETEVHATIAANIIDNQYAFRVRPFVNFILMLSLLVLMAVYFKYSRALWDVFMVAAVFCVYYAASEFLFTKYNIFTDMAPYAVLAVLHLAAIRIYQNVRTLYLFNLELTRKNRELMLMDTINQAIINKTGGELLCEILNIIINTVRSERGSILLMAENENKLMLKYVYSIADKAPVLVKEYISFNIGEGIAGNVAESGEMLVSNDTTNDEKFKMYASEDMNKTIKNIACVPLKSDREIFGVLNVVNKPGGFTGDDGIILQNVADQVAVALQNAKFYELAITDSMTKLYIQRYFQARLDSEVKRTRRFGFKFSFMMLDIDHFKKFNDTYGHQVGDMVLIHVARTLLECIRMNLDIPARYGGEEFALIMPETDAEGALILAERIRQSIADSFVEHAGEKLRVTVSIGFCEYTAEVGTKQELILRADSALYRSKETGRNRTTRWDETMKNIKEK